MDNNLSSIEVECECGGVHELLSMQVYFNDFTELFEKLESEDLRVIRLFILKELEESVRVQELQKTLMNSGFTVIKTVINCKHGETIKANSLLYEGEEYILAIGNSGLFEMIKYYAYSVNIDYSIFLYNEFYDYTFSKFARLYDGLCFNFYSCCAPKAVIFFFDDYNGENEHKMILYLRAKVLALFENVLAEKFGTLNICGKINSKLRKIEKISDKIKNIKDVLYSCIFLGRAMSFFNCTKGFFGAEIEIANQLEIISKKSFIDCYLLGFETTRRIYITALNKNLSILRFDINKRIDNLKTLLSITATKCLTFMKKQKERNVLAGQIKIAGALKFKLLSFLEDFEIFETFNISGKMLSNAIYIAPEMTARYTFLNFIRDLGYLENLV